MDMMSQTMRVNGSLFEDETQKLQEVSMYTYDNTHYATISVCFLSMTFCHSDEGVYKRGQVTTGEDEE